MTAFFVACWSRSAASFCGRSFLLLAVDAGARDPLLLSAVATFFFSRGRVARETA